MSELTYSIPILSTLEELEQAIQRYKASDLSGSELLIQWEAIRDASLNQALSAADADKVPGQDSY
ncbi:MULTISPECIES: hypothetical protein [Argonema]|uniref:hypothetical protein n=1 Tax=Argonema TaxID=2942761 RepID=UPI002013AB90|nr:MULTISPECIES: hypothetical protein [Argonema]MCL1462995.1 hypothetical protein [Argonema galeatum A003/A1]MCL1469134.1 hypothetical protein [Argonema antarcticum A004/B2]